MLWHTQYNLNSDHSLPIHQVLIPAVFAGDAKQTLHPSAFCWPSLKDVLYDESANLFGDPKYAIRREEIHLTCNYRMSIAVGELAQSLLAFRHARCKVSSSREELRPWREELGSVIRVIDDHLVSTMLLKPGAVIVPEHLADQPAWSTPSEVKGREFRTVIIRGFGAQYQALKKEAEGRRPGLPNKAMEFFLNRLYVAVTRALEKIAFIDSTEADSVLWDDLTPFFKQNSFTPPELVVANRLSELDESMEEHLKNARVSLKAVLACRDHAEAAIILLQAATQFNHANSQSRAEACKLWGKAFDAEKLDSSLLLQLRTQSAEVYTCAKHYCWRYKQFALLNQLHQGIDEYEEDWRVGFAGNHYRFMILNRFTNYQEQSNLLHAWHQDLSEPCFWEKLIHAQDEDRRILDECRVQLIQALREHLEEDRLCPDLFYRNTLRHLSAIVEKLSNKDISPNSTLSCNLLELLMLGNVAGGDVEAGRIQYFELCRAVGTDPMKYIYSNKDQRFVQLELCLWWFTPAQCSLAMDWMSHPPSMEVTETIRAALIEEIFKHQEALDWTRPYLTLLSRLKEGDLELILSMVLVRGLDGNLETLQRLQCIHNTINK